MILDHFISKAKYKDANIGICLDDTDYHTNKIFYAAVKFFQEFKSFLLRLHVFGPKNSIDLVLNNPSFEKYKSHFVLIESNNPAQDVFEHLRNFKINAIVRGSISASKFLNVLKNSLGVSEINRLALMETLNGAQFFFGPVGIDEANTIETKKEFIMNAIAQMESIKIKPKISVLSGGRTGDLGRDENVDKTIHDAMEIVEIFQKETPIIEISHSEILIENAIKGNFNLIIAPDGISGNLIYRTLVHLGGGHAYGAIYMNIDKTIIDTSRVGNMDEIYGALILALALVSEF
ncbi:MAG: methanogenesis marker protein Mmp4/MtxX [Candidatus Hodarchaeota archaeon]